METSLVVPVADADPLVRRWRATWDPSARLGVSAHITVAAPFLPSERVSEAVRRRLASIAEAHPPIEIVLSRVVHLPGAISLLPADDRDLAALTRSLVGPWRDVTRGLRTGRARPYHLTAACTNDAGLFDEIAAGLRGRLPIRVRLRDVHLIAHSPHQVRLVADFRLCG